MGDRHSSPVVIGSYIYYWRRAQLNHSSAICKFLSADNIELGREDTSVIGVSVTCLVLVFSVVYNGYQDTK